MEKLVEALFFHGLLHLRTNEYKGFSKGLLFLLLTFFFLVCVFVRPSLGHSNIEPKDMFEVTNINFSEVMIRCQS